MTFRVHPLEMRDIAYVVDNLWLRGLDEMQRYGMSGRAELALRLASMAYDAPLTLWHEGAQVAICGTHFCNVRRERYTWFAATDAFPRAGIRITHFLRCYLRRWREERPTEDIVLLSAIDHPKAARWFSLLGFTEDGGEPPFRRYRFRALTKAT